MINDRPRRDPSPMTARELLVEAAGEEHELHSVVARVRALHRGTLAFKCVCGALCTVPATPQNQAALQNVVEEK